MTWFALTYYKCVLKRATVNDATSAKAKVKSKAKSKEATMNNKADESTTAAKKLNAKDSTA